MWTPFASYSNLEAKLFILVCECYKKPTIMHIFRESSSNGPWPFLCKKMGTGIYQCCEMRFGLYLAQLSYDRQLYFNNWRDSLSVTMKLFCFKIPSDTYSRPPMSRLAFSGNPDGNEMLWTSYDDQTRVNMSYECSYIESKVMLLQY